MIRIDDTLLEEVGLISLPKAERDQMLRQIYETLEMRVGMKLAERMSDQQLDEFERFIDTNDEAGALKWLETNFPDYKKVVADELEKLKTEIKNDSAKIIEAMRAQSLQQPQQYQQPEGQPSFAPQQPQYQQAPPMNPAPAEQYQQYAPQPQAAAYAQPQQYQQPQSVPQDPGFTPQQPIQPQPFPQQPVQLSDDPVQQDQTASQAVDSQQQGSVPPPPAY